jgi:hypothetical protein
MMNLGSLGISALAQTHLTEGMVKQVSLPDPRPAMMITWSVALWSLVLIVVRADLPSVDVTVSVVSQSRAAGVTARFLG